MAQKSRNKRTDRSDGYIFIVIPVCERKTQIVSGKMRFSACTRNDSLVYDLYVTKRVMTQIQHVTGIFFLFFFFRRVIILLLLFIAKKVPRPGCNTNDTTVRRYGNRRRPSAMYFISMKNICFRLYTAATRYRAVAIENSDHSRLLWVVKFIRSI